MVIQQANDGFNVTGTWENIRTGEKLFIRDSVIEDENMNLITDKGIFPLSMIMNDYVQVSDDVSPQVAKQVFEQSKQHNDMIEDLPYSGPISLDTPITDDILSGKVIPEVKKQPEYTTQYTQQPNNTIIENKVEVKTESFEDTMLAKMIGNAKKLKLKLVVDWENIPVTELKMINTMFGIDSGQISEYIIKNIIPDEHEVYDYFRNILEECDD